QDQLGVGVVGRLPSRALVARIAAIGHAHGKDLGLRRHVRPELRAAAEHVEEALRRGAAVQHRQAARARGIETGGIALLGAPALQLTVNATEGFLPSDALERAAPARAFAPERILEAVGMVDALDLAYSARAGMQRRQLRLPSARVGRDLDNAAIANV